MPQGAFPLTTVNKACLDGWGTEIHTTINPTSTTTNKTTDGSKTPEITTTPSTSTTIVATTGRASVLAGPNWMVTVLIALALSLGK